MPPGIVRRKRGNAMYNKNERTMEAYVEAGAYARLLSDIGTKSKADDQLFRDYPALGHEGTDVFYGTLGQEPRNQLDEEIISIAKQKAMGLFDCED